MFWVNIAKAERFSRNKNPKRKVKPEAPHGKCGPSFCTKNGKFAALCLEWEIAKEKNLVVPLLVITNYKRLILSRGLF